MTPTQKRIIVVLAVVTVVVIVALVLLVTFSLRAVPPSISASHLETPTPQESSLLADEALTAAASLPTGCQWRAAQLMAEAGLGGTVALSPDGILRFDVIYPLAPDQSVDEAAQATWVVFDVALALVEDECETISQVEVAIRARNDQGDVLINASVSAADLIAFGAGELTEDEFIHRVTYWIGGE
jgi:hypothetical protein